MPSKINSSAYSYLVIKCATQGTFFVCSLGRYFRLDVLYRPVLSYQGVTIVNSAKEIREKPGPILKAED